MQPETLAFACLLRCRVAEAAVLGGFVTKRPSENAFTGFQTAYSATAFARCTVFLVYSKRLRCPTGLSPACFL